MDDLCFGGGFVAHIHVRELDPHVHRRRDHQLVPVLVDELDVQNPQEGLAPLLQVQRFFDLRGVLLKGRLVPFAHRGSCPARQNLVDLQLHAHRQLRLLVKSHIDLICLLFIFINKLSLFSDQWSSHNNLRSFFGRCNHRSLALGSCFALSSGTCQAFICSCRAFAGTCSFACSGCAGAFACACCARAFACACAFACICSFFAVACACSGRIGICSIGICITGITGRSRIVSAAAIAIIAIVTGITVVSVIGTAVVGATVVGVSIAVVSATVIVTSGTGVFSTARIIISGAAFISGVFR